MSYRVLSLFRLIWRVKMAAVSVVLTVALLAQSGLADAAQATLWADRQSVPVLAHSPADLPLPRLSLEHAALSTGSLSADKAIAAATAAGARVSVHAGRPDRVIVLLQDIHANPEAQRNIERVMSGLIGGGLSLVALEGLFAARDVSRFTAFPDQKSLAVTTRYFVGEGTLSGAAAAALTAGHPVSVAGIDDRPLYDANVNAYLSSRSLRAPTLAALAAERVRMNAAPVSSRLKSFDADVRGYHDGRASIGDYLARLAQISGARPTVSNFLKAISLERGLNTPNIERDREEVLRRLSEHMSADQAARLLADAAAFRSGRMSAADFYGRLAALAENAGVSLSKAPAFRSYVDYVLLADRIDSAHLFAEMAEMEEIGYSRLAVSDADRRWSDLSRLVALAGKLTDFSLSPAEWRDYLRLSGRARIPTVTLSVFEDFYRFAERRNGALYENLRAQFPEKGAAYGAAVVGGFHADALSERLNRAGWTVVMVTPRVTKADSSRASVYLSLFAREKTPLEKLFSAERLFVSPDPFLAAARIPVVAAGIHSRNAATTSPVDDIRSLDPSQIVVEATVRTDGDRTVVQVTSDAGTVEVVEVVRADGELGSVQERAATFRDGWLKTRQRIQRFSFAAVAAIIMVLRALGMPETEWSKRFVPAPPTATFLGAAGGIGNSSTLLTIGGARVLVDAGLDFRSSDPFPRFDLITTPPDVIVITHAHTDHIGSLPYLLKKFPNVPVYASEATIRLMRAMLPSSLQSLRKFGITGADIDATLNNIIPIEVGVDYKLNDHAWMRAIGAGHLLGARSLEFGSLGGHAFLSGDIGTQPQITVGVAAAPAKYSDLFIVESTQGDRATPPRSEEAARFLEICRDTIRRGGSLMIPALALARSQEILFLLRDAQESGDPVLRDVDIFFDGMISKTNAAFMDAVNDLPNERREIVQLNGGLYAGEGVKIRPVKDFERESVRDRLHDAEGKPVIVVAPAGMLNAGTILDYVEAGIENPLNTLLYVNYQPTGGLGLKIAEARASGRAVVIDGQPVRVAADVASVSLSAHASGPDLESYISAARPRRGAVVLVHGHPNAIAGLKARPAVAVLRPLSPAVGDAIQARRPPLLLSLYRLLLSLFRKPIALPTSPLKFPVREVREVRASRPRSSPRPTKSPIGSSRATVPVEVGQIVIVDAKDDFAYVTSADGGRPLGIRNGMRLWKKDVRPREEEPLDLLSKDARPVEVIGSVPELNDPDPRIAAARFRAFIRASRPLLGGNTRSVWALIQALAGGRPMTIDEMVAVILSDEGEAATAVRQSWINQVRPISKAPGGQDEVDAYNSLAGLVSGRVELALKISLIYALQDTDFYFSMDPETGVRTPIDFSALVSDYGIDADELNHQIAVAALPIGSEVTIPPGVSFKMNIGNERKNVEFGEPISARIEAKTGNHLVVSILFKEASNVGEDVQDVPPDAWRERPVRTFINYKNVRIGDVEEGPSNEASASIPAFERMYLRISALWSSTPTETRRSFYRRGLAAVAESWVAPGLGGWLLALAFGAAGMDTQMAWTLGQISASSLFFLFHAPWRSGNRVAPALVASVGLAASLSYRPEAWAGVLLLTFAIAVFHFFVNNAAPNWRAVRALRSAKRVSADDSASPQGQSRRAFLRRMAQLSVQVAGASPMAKVAERLAGASTLAPSAAQNTASAVEALSSARTSAFYGYVESEGLHEHVIASLLRQNLGVLPPAARAAELADQAILFQNVSPERRLAAQQLANLIRTSEARNLSVEGILTEARGIMRRLVTQAVNAARAPSSNTASVPTPNTLDSNNVTPAPAEPGPARNFFNVTDDAGMTEAVLAAILSIEIVTASNDVQRVFSEDAAAALAALTPNRRELAMELARIWLASAENGTDPVPAAEHAVSVSLARGNPLYIAYMAAEPTVIGTLASDLDRLTRTFSDETTSAYLTPSDFPLIKALARRAGIADDVMALALTEPEAYRQRALDIHPYAIRARAELDRFASIYLMHDGAYHVMRELRKAGQLPENTILINVDPHQDLAHSDDPNAPVTAGTWIGHALRERLAKIYIQARYTKDGVTFTAYTMDPATGLLTNTEQTEARVKEIIAGKNVLLTVDADAFNLKDDDHDPFVLSGESLEARFDEIAGLVADSNVLRVVGAISPDYLNYTFGDGWIESWTAAFERAAGTIRDSSAPLGISLLQARPYQNSPTATGRLKIALISAPILETLIIGLLFGIWPHVLAVPFSVSLLLAVASGLFFVMIHPRVFRGMSTVAVRHSARDRARLLAQGLLYGLAFVLSPLVVADPTSSFLIAVAMASTLHSAFNLQAILTGKALGVATPNEDERERLQYQDGDDRRMLVTDEFDALTSLLRQTPVARPFEDDRRSVDSYRFNNVLQEFAAHMILSPLRLNRRDLRAWLARSQIVEFLNEREQAQLVRQVTSGPLRDSVDLLLRSADSAIAARRVGEAFRNRNVERFRVEKERFERLFGGRALIVSNQANAVWFDEPLLRPEGFDTFIESIAGLIPAGFPEATLSARRLVETILLSTSRSIGKVGLLLIEPNRPSLDGLIGQLVRHRAASVRLTTENIPWILSPAPRLNASGWGRETNSYKGPGLSSFGGYLKTDLLVIPSQRARRAEPGDVLDRLDGGSNSTVERIASDQNTTRIVKTAPAIDSDRASGIPSEEAMKKLRGEASVMQRLYGEGYRFLPEILQIDEAADRVSVVMEDLGQAGYVPAASLFFFDYARLVPPDTIWQLALDVLQELSGAMYARQETPTPDNFIEDSRIGHVRKRLRQAAEKAPSLTALFDAPVVLVRGLHSGGAVLGFEQMVPFILATAHILTPPSLRPLMGDLHFGNLMVNPFEFERLGRFASFRLLDFNDRANDFVYDLAKIIHSFYGRYEILRMDSMYRFVTEDSMTVGGASVPIYDEWLNDEETNSIPLSVTDDLTDIFIEWLRGADGLLGLEEGSAWKARLLFTHAMLMLGLAPFHLSNDGTESRATGLYLTGLELLSEALDLTINGAFDAGLPAALPRVSPEIRAVWNGIYDSFRHRSPDDRPVNLKTYYFERSRIDQVRKLLHAGRDGEAARVMRLFESLDTGRGYTNSFNLLGRFLSASDLDLYIRAVILSKLGARPIEIARLRGLTKMSGRTNPARTDAPAFVTVTLNPVVDVTEHGYFSDEPVTLYAGGKGQNMARALRSWSGRDPVALGIIGGDTGQLHAALSEAEGVPSGRMTVTQQPTRLSMAVSEYRRSGTRYVGASPAVTASALRRFRSSFKENVRAGDIVLLAGSLPPGVPSNEYARLTRTAKAAGAKVYVDAKGEPLRQALGEKPHFVGVNLDEFADAMGVPSAELAGGLPAIVGLVQTWIDAGIDEVVITLGEDGLLFVGKDQGVLRAWHAHSSRVHVMDTAGAGDTVKSAFAYGESVGLERVEALRLAAAARAVTVSKSDIGMSTLEEAQVLAPRIEITEVPVVNRDSSAQAFGISFLFGRLYQKSGSNGRTAIALLGAPLLETLLLGGLFGAWPFLFSVPALVSIFLIPAAAGLFFVLIHPQIFKGGSGGKAYRPSRRDRIMFLFEGMLFGTIFSILPIFVTDYSWGVAFITATLIHSLLNAVALMKGEALAVAGAGSDEDRAAQVFADGLFAASQGRPDMAMASVVALLNDAPVSMNVETIDGRISVLEAAARTGRFDDPNFSALVREKIRYQFGRAPSAAEIRLYLQRWTSLTSGRQQAPAIPAPIVAGVTLVLVDASMGKSLGAMVRQAIASAGDDGSVLFATANDDLAGQVETALKKLTKSQRTMIETRSELFHSSGEALRVSLAEISAAFSVPSSLGGKSITRVLASDRVALDSDGLSPSDPLRAAVFVILSALGPVGMSAGDLDRIGALARLITTQA